MTDWFDGAGNGQAVDVGALFDSDATGWFSRIIQGGALLSLGTTFDGGALGVTVTVNGRWRREYFRTSEDLIEWLSAAADAVEQADARPSASSEPRKRTRRSRGL
jgi:hypothetical protein